MPQGNYRSDQIFAYLVPSQARPAGPAGHSRVQDPAFKGGVHFGECYELGIGTHAVNQVAEHRAVAPGLHSLEVFPGP